MLDSRFDIRRTLKDVFGYDSFKQGQEPLIAAILQNRDVFGVMPTGAGKSICYQLPATLMPGVTLVISPLISLMKDQVDALNEIGIPTVSINSSLSASEYRACCDGLRNGRYKVVYIAPERLESDAFTAFLQSLDISLAAIDEAHCVSQWGHDFRPSYLRIKPMLAKLERRPVVAAFTATATDAVKEDIVRQLGLQDPYRLTTGYARDNLAFSVVKTADKRKFMADFIRERSRSCGIVYASTRKQVEECHQFLQRLGIAAGRYHAGLSDEERTTMQERFLYDELQVMVATNAFGMGIDKSNVRYVIHYNMPKNLESYYQEAGRAGRDGEPGECILLYSPQDIQIQKFLIEQSDRDEDRKQIDYANLRDMADYAHTSACLQHYIVRYFGDPDARECGRCGNCTDDREAKDVTLDAQKIFSCIVRMKMKFGVTMTAKVLRGAKDQKVLQFGFDRLPTYGAMADRTEKEIIGLIQALAADRYVTLSDGKYPTLSLTERARAVLQGEEKVYYRAVVVKKEVRGYAGSHEALFERLRELRKAFADKQKVPPFTIFHDATLRDMCERLPATEEEMLAVKGVGQSKFAKYGAAFLDAVRAYRGSD